MKFISITIGLISFLFMIDFLTSRKLINKYTIEIIFGKPGSGKSTMLNMLEYKYVKKGWLVYTDDPTTKIAGVQYFDSQKFKSGEWLPNGNKGCEFVKGAPVNEKNQNILLCFDEIGILYNNRDFKNNLTPVTLDWWKKHRHNRVKVIMCSQVYKDMDLKIRSMAQKLWIVKRSIFKNFAVARPIMISIDIQNNESGENSGGQIVDLYKYDLFLFWKWILLPKWIKKFDSYR